MNLKRELALQIVKELHTEKDAKEALDNFEKTFQEKKPEYEEELSNKGNLVDSLGEILGSKSEAKRIIKQGGVDVNGEKIEDGNLKLETGDKIMLEKEDSSKVK